MRELINVGAVALKSAHKEKGITLVALIITIIVMLILVGVSVQVVINSDLIGKAQDAANRTEIAYEEEGSTGEITVGDKTYVSVDEYLAGNYIMPEGAGEKFTETDEYFDGTNTAVIPEGFTVSGVRGEETIEGGLVIYLIDDKTEEEIEAINWNDGTTVANLQQTYDQFVWIPIKNTTDANAQDINDMYICQGKGAENGACTITVQNGVATCTNENHSAIVEGTTTNKNTLMAGRLYATAQGETFEQGYTEIYTEGTGLREPDVITGMKGTAYDVNTTNLGQLNTILGTNYGAASELKTDLQIEYNNVVKSVYENQGFYIGRYETSNITTTNGTAVTIQAGKAPSATIAWYYMYAQQKEYASNNSLTVGSTMLQGAAYDQVMKFVNTESYSVTTEGNVGHGSSQGVTLVYLTKGLNYSGTVPYKDVSKNIYDLEGNVSAITIEASDYGQRVTRGSYQNCSKGYSASNRGGYSPQGSSVDNVGTICQLYILE